MNTKQIIALAVAVVLAVTGVGFAIAASDPVDRDAIEQLSPSEYETQARTQAEVKLLAVGDNLIHKAIYKQAQARTGDGSYNFKPVYENLADMISSADIAIINQETMMSSLSEPSTYPCFNTPTAMASDLAEIGFDVLSIANNHMLDVSSNGLISTLDLINSTNGIISAGAYHSRDEYQSLKTIEVDGVSFVFLSYTEHTNGISLPESKEDYIIYMDELDDVRAQVEYADKIADVVVVSMHAGIEYSDAPHAVQKRFAEKVVGWGADLVLGSHPHTLQPIDYIKNAQGKEVPIIYSLGNFVSTQDQPKRLIGGIANITVTKDFSSGEVTVGKPLFDIVITHYRTGNSGVKLYTLSQYSDELASQHGVGGFSLDFIYSHIRKILGEEHLIPAYRTQ